MRLIRVLQIASTVMITTAAVGTFIWPGSQWSALLGGLALGMTIRGWADMRWVQRESSAMLKILRGDS